MTALTDYAEQKLLEHFFRGVSYASPSTVYAAIMRATSSETGTGGNEPVGLSGYSRQPLSFGSYASRQLATNAQLDWSPLVDWGLGVEIGIFDAATGGNLLVKDIVLSPQQNLLAGGPFSIVSGDLIVRLLADAANLSGVMPWLAQRMLEHLLKGANHASISTRKVHLATTLPSPDGVGGVYLGAGDYTPQNISFAAYDAVASGCFASANVVFRGSTGGAWGVIPGYVISDGSDPLASNLLYCAPILPQPNVGAASPMSLLAASTSIRLF